LIDDGKVYGMNESIDHDANRNEIITPTPCVTIGGLLARFDPADHQHDLMFDIEASGTETRC
jgi:hypothetical protein